MAIKSCSYGIINIINKFNQQTEPLGVSLVVLGLMDGRLASSFDDNTIKITNDSQFNKYSILSSHSDLINALAELDNHVLASGSCDNTIRLWNLTSEKKIAKLTNHTGCIRALLSISVNTKNLLISASDDKTIKIWENYKLFKSFANNSDSVKALAYSDRYRMLATGSNDRLINIYQLREYSFGKSTNFSWQKFVSVRVNALAILASSNNIVSAYSDKTIKIFEPDNFEPIAILIGHTDEVNALAILPSSERIVSGSSDTTIKIWDSETFECIANLTGNNDHIIALTILPSSERIVSGSYWPPLIKIWDSNTFEFITDLIGEYSSYLMALAILPSSENIVSGTAFPENAIKIWNSKTFELIDTIIVGNSGVWALSILPSSESIVIGIADGTIKIWRQTFITTLKGNWILSPVLALAVSPLTENIASAYADNTIRVWDSKKFILINTLVEKSTIEVTLNGLKVLEFFSPETLMAGLSNRIEILKIREFSLAGSLDGHTDTIYDLKFSNNADLVSSSKDETTKVWDISSFSLKKTENLGEVLSLFFLKNHDLVTASVDKSIKIWNTNFFYNISIIQ